MSESNACMDRDGAMPAPRVTRPARPETARMPDPIVETVVPLLGDGARVLADEIDRREHVIRSIN